MSLPPVSTNFPVTLTRKIGPKPPLAKGLPSERSHDEPVSWTIELTAPANVQQGETVLSGYIGFQTCDDKRCLAPEQVEMTFAVEIA